MRGMPPDTEMPPTRMNSSGWGHAPHRLSLLGNEDSCEEFADLVVGVEREDAGDVLIGADDDYGTVTADAALVVDVFLRHGREDLLHVFEVELAHMWAERRRDIGE